jgi:hypothetical protein
VNDKKIFMQQTQAYIESQRFFYQLPKHLQDKIKPLEDNSDKTDKDKKDGKKRPGHDKNDYLKRQRVNEEQHPHWHLKEGENYGQLFYPYADKSPKTTNGSTICVRFFVRGFCEKTCTRAHKLSKQEE